MAIRFSFPPPLSMILDLQGAVCSTTSDISSLMMRDSDTLSEYSGARNPSSFESQYALSTEGSKIPSTESTCSFLDMTEDKVQLVKDVI
jgi:hypothetical protein